MKLLYLVPRFPVASETFVAEEIMGMMERGLDIDVVALVKPDDAEIIRLGQHMRDLVSKVFYLRKYPVTWSVFRLLLPFWHQRNQLIDGSPWYSPGALARLLRAVVIAERARKQRVEFIYAHWPRPSEVAILVHEMTDIPFAISVHAHEVAHDNAYFPCAFRQVEFAAFCNDGARQYLAERVAGVSERSLLLYHGVDISQFAFQTMTTVRGALKIVTAGRLTPTKGMDRLIRCVAHARNEKVSVELTIVGDGGEQAKLEQLVRSLDLEDIVTFTGWISHEEMPRRLSEAHVFALLADDNFHDGLPNVVFESMALGRPIILSALPAAQEAIEDGINGYILQRYDDPTSFVEVCRCLLTTEGLVEKLGRQARQTVVERFDRASLYDELHSNLTEYARD